MIWTKKELPLGPNTAFRAALPSSMPPISDRTTGARAAAICLGMLLCACGAPQETRESDVEPASPEDVDTAMLASTLGTVTVDQEDRVRRGWWMKSEATVRADGQVVGSTELKNSRSLFGFHGETTVVLVDRDGHVLKYLPAGIWGIDPCDFRCPRKRFVTWEVGVGSDEWATIGPQVGGAAILHRWSPQNSFWDWLKENPEQVAEIVRTLIVLF